MKTTGAWAIAPPILAEDVEAGSKTNPACKLKHFGILEDPPREVPDRCSSRVAAMPVVGRARRFTILIDPKLRGDTVQ
jgi:hypothetical protein